MIPLYGHTHFIAGLLQYVDAVRFGDFEALARIESAASGWWFPTLDRGAGALLHFAVDHGRLSMVKFLVEERKVEVNQRDKSTGWTPLHRCAYVVHYRHAPYFEIFEYLLSRGADPNLLSYGDNVYDTKGGLKTLDLVVKKGDGWGDGEVGEKVAQLIAKYDQTPKKKDYVYTGPPFGTVFFWKCFLDST